MTRICLVLALSIVWRPVPPSPLLAQVGELRVAVETSGTPTDVDGYTIAVDDHREFVDATGAVTFTQLKPGLYVANILDVADHCRVANSDSQTIVVRSESVAELRFAVICEPSTTARPAPEVTSAPSARPPNAPPEARRRPGVTREATPNPSLAELPADRFWTGQWVATIDPPGSPPYPVYMNLFSEPTVGGVFGNASYEAEAWTCAFELTLEEATEDSLVVAQQLTHGYCPDGTRVSLARRSSDIAATWLHPDGSPWFEAEFRRAP